MSKLYRARSLLYRRQILQVNIRWKALDEIYKIYMLLHRSDLNISENFRQFFFTSFGKILQKLVIFEFFSLIFAQILMKFCRNFADNLEKVEIFRIFEFSRENSYFERIRMVRMVRMVRSLADRTFQLW